MACRKFSATLLVLLVMLAACQPAPPALTPVTLQLHWTHQAQFGGFYDADQNSYYAADGLAVTFREGSPTLDPLTPVLAGTAQFGLASADGLILARADGKPLRAIATIYRHSPAVFIALAASGILRPQDFVGKTIAVARGSRQLLDGITARAGVQPDQYTVVDLEPDLVQLYSGKVQVAGAYLTNEVIAAQAAGYKINIIYPDDYGVHFYADTLFTTDDLIRTNPDLVKRFLRATLKGWTNAVENPASVGPMVIKYKPGANVEHEIALMTASVPLVNTGEDHIGWMKPEVWAGMEKTLRALNILTKAVDITQVYTLQFLNEVYP